MGSREELLDHLWHNVIDPVPTHEALQRLAEEASRNPDAPFADSGAAIARLLALGASPADIGAVMRSVAYDAVFSTLYALDDPGVDDGDVFMLFESLLSADPSGREGRPPAQSWSNPPLERP